MRGHIKWFDARKGYGFIEREGEEDVFVHFTAIRMEGYKELVDGEEVEFEITRDGQNRPQARRVIRIEAEAAIDPVAQVTQQYAAEQEAHLRAPKDYSKFIGRRCIGQVDTEAGAWLAVSDTDPAVTVTIRTPFAHGMGLKEGDRISYIVGWDNDSRRLIATTITFV